MWSRQRMLVVVQSILVSIVAMCAPAPITYADEVWQALAGGMNGNVNAITVYNGALVAGGSFTVAGSTAASRIARWDGLNWQSLSTGLNGDVYALTVYNGDLIAAGFFTNAGGVAANCIARWNGSNWQPLGTGMTLVVYALAVYNGELIAGGGFTSAGGVSASRIARWNGSTWQSLGSGMNSTVYSLTVFNGELIAGGNFTSVNGNSAIRGVARWNGLTWQSLGTGIIPSLGPGVRALCTYNNDLIAGGSFTNAGGVTVNNLARWNGTSWFDLGGGTSNVVRAMTIYSGELIVVGEFASVGNGSVAANRIARWNGTNWQLPLGSGLDDHAAAVTVWNNSLVVGGLFTVAGGEAVNHLALTTANSTIAVCELWQTLGSGMSGINSPDVSALTVYNGQLIAGGNFTTAGGSPANRIARWDGTAWQPLGTGMTISGNLVKALTVYNGELIAGGIFTNAGGVLANNIARWNGTTWQPLGSGLSGPNATVTALTIYNGDLIAVGNFTLADGLAANRIARWDGVSWHPFGSGFDSFVYAVMVYNEDIIVAGNFSTAGGVAANRIARWNGIAWQPIGSGMNDYVFSLHEYNGELIAGGQFTTAGGVIVNQIARWSGLNWQPLGTGMAGGVVQKVLSLGVYDGELIAGGAFERSGGVWTSGIARWNGSAWSALGNGMGIESDFPFDYVYVSALAEYNNELIAGGNYAFPGRLIARWHPNEWLTPATGNFDNENNWNNGYSAGSATSFGSNAGGDPFTVHFAAPAQSSALCITNQRPIFELNSHQYSITNYTTIGGTNTASLTVNNGTLVSPIVAIGSFGTLSGNGTIVGNIFNVGAVQPGSAPNSPSTISITGRYEQPSFGTLDIGIGATSHGNLNITGNAEIAGTLRVQMVNVNEPQAGSYPLITATGTITGAFDVALLPFIGDDQVMNLEYPGGPANVAGSTDSTQGDGHTPPSGPGGAINITIGTPEGSPNPDAAQNVGLTGIPTGITGAFIQTGATESDLALSIADLDPQENGNVLVLLNNGSGTSFVPILVEVGREPSGIASAALADGAAIDDLAVPNLGDNTVIVLFHDGSPTGNYTVVTISTGIGNQPSAITAIDLNGDSLADLAATNRGDNTVSILINNGNRTFTPIAGGPIPVGGEPVSICSGNFSGSVLNDLVIANSTSNTITLLENLGGGLTYTPTTIPVGPKPIIVNPTDVDNDRDLDIVVSLEDGASVALVRNLGGGVLSSPVNLPMDGEPGSMDAWDMDKDGDEDVVVIVFDDVLQEPVIRLLRNDSTPTQIAYTVFDPIGQGENPQLVNGSDVSGDTVEDLVSVNVTPLPMAMSGPGSDSSMSIREMLLGTEPLCRADVAPVGNLDNTVGVPDLLFIINNWGPCANPRNCPADVAPFPGGDDTVGVPDLLYIINNWGPCP